VTTTESGRSERQSPTVRGLAGTRRARLLIGLIVVLALLATGALTLLSRPGAAVTLSAAPGGRIDPDGVVRAPIGADLTVTVWTESEGLEPILLVGTTSITPRPDGAGRYSYSLRITGDTTVQASFVRLADNVRQVAPGDGGDIVSVSAKQDEVVLRAGAAVLERLSVNDILASTPASGRPEPLLVRILEIRGAGDQVFLLTEPAPLTDAIVQASIRAALPLPLGSAETTSHRQDLSRAWSAGASGASGSVITSGSLEIAAELQAALEIEPGSRGGRSAGVVRLFETAFAQRLSSDARLEAQAELDIDESALLLSRTLPSFCISIACFAPSVELSTGLRASGSAPVTMTGSFSQEARLGVRYDGASWSSIEESRLTPTGFAELVGPAAIRFSPTARFESTLFALASPWVATQPGFLELSADTAADPWWILDAGVRFAGGVDLDFPDVFDGSWNREPIELARVTVAQAPGPLPGGGPTPVTTAGPLPSIDASDVPDWCVTVIGRAVELRPGATFARALYNAFEDESSVSWWCRGSFGTDAQSHRVETYGWRFAFDEFVANPCGEGEGCSVIEDLGRVDGLGASAWRFRVQLAATSSGPGELDVIGIELGDGVVGFGCRDCQDGGALVPEFVRVALPHVPRP
jgi:hypothetical protein